MVEDVIRDGRRIAQLLASELDGREDGALAPLAVTNADPDVEPTVDGARAYDVTRDGDPLATVFVHEDRVRVEIRAGQDAAADAATTVVADRDGDAGIRVRPKAVDPPVTVLFVETGAAVKLAADVVDAASAAAE